MLRSDAEPPAAADVVCRAGDSGVVPPAVHGIACHDRPSGVTTIRRSSPGKRSSDTADGATYTEYFNAASATPLIN
jgi:hypothetical protein